MQSAILPTVRDAEVWFAPIFGTRVMVPYRFSLPTPVGTGVLQATAVRLGAETAACCGRHENAVIKNDMVGAAPAQHPRYPQECIP